MKLRSLHGTAVASRDSARVSMPDVVREGLRKAILNGSLISGTQLRQDELAEKFGSSRIPVREALRQLEAEGFVTLNPNRGAVVSTISLDEVLELLEIRIGLECRALRLAIPQMVQADFEAAEDVLKSYEVEPSPENWGEMNRRFHETLYAPCGRPKLLALIESNYGHVSRFIRIQVSLASGKEDPNKEHRQILKACTNEDVNRAVALLEGHIQHTQRALIAAVRRSASKK